MDFFYHNNPSQFGVNVCVRSTTLGIAWTKSNWRYDRDDFFRITKYQRLKGWLVEIGRLTFYKIGTNVAKAEYEETE